MSWSLRTYRVEPPDVDKYYALLDQCEGCIIRGGQAPMSASSLFPLLLGGDGILGDFFAHCWEKYPCHFSRNSTEDSFKSIFCKDLLLKTIDENHLSMETNFAAMKYTENNGRVSFEGESAKEALNSGNTVQFFQPQRFCHQLFAIMSSCETLFGTLAGASAYLTPPNAQGLAPHHDDVEVFVIQTEGSKLWHLWPPVGIDLPETYSNDLDRNQLDSSRMVTVLLRKGDVLYMPRGTVHEARAEKQFSTHITISLYQKYNVKALANFTATRLLENAFSEMSELRRGLPRQIGQFMGTYAAAKEELRLLPASVRDARAELVQDIKKALLVAVEKLTAQDVDEAVDVLLEDFTVHRLPPIEAEDTSVRVANVNATTTVRMVHSSNLRLVTTSKDGVRLLWIRSNQFNNRLEHMGHPLPDTDDCDSAHDESENSDSDRNSDSDSDGDDESANAEDWMSSDEDGALLPVRLIPVIDRLMAHSDAGELVSARQLVHEVGCDRFDEAEVSAVLSFS